MLEINLKNFLNTENIRFLLFLAMYIKFNDLKVKSLIKSKLSRIILSSNGNSFLRAYLIDLNWYKNSHEENL